MTSWDRRSDSRLRKLQDELVRAQARAVSGGSAYWKQRFAAAGRTASSIDGAAALESLPAVGERDVSANGDPAAMAALVLHGGERQFALHASGSDAAARDPVARVAVIGLPAGRRQRDQADHLCLDRSQLPLSAGLHAR